MASKTQASGAGSGAGALPAPAAFGVDLNKFDVRAHHDGYKPSAIGAKAYATGGHVSFKGDADPSLGLTGHEAAHVVQQAASPIKKPTAGG